MKCLLCSKIHHFDNHTGQKIHDCYRKKKQMNEENKTVPPLHCISENSGNKNLVFYKKYFPKSS